MAELDAAGFIRAEENDKRTYLNDPTRLTSDGDSTGWRP